MTLVGVVTVIALAGYAALLLLRPGLLPGDAAITAAKPTISPSPVDSSTPSPVNSAGTDPTVVAKFEDSPARSWARGTAGLKAPMGVRVGRFGPHQVNDAYAKVIAFLEVATLDGRVVFQGQLQPVFDAIGPDNTRWVKQQHQKGKASHWTDGSSWAVLVNRFRPGDWRASKDTRVRLKMTALKGRSADELKIHYVDITAYWLEPKAGGDHRTVAIRREGDIFFYEAGTSTVSPPNVGFSSYTSTAGACNANWKDHNYLEAWVTRPVETGPPSPAPTQTWDPTDPDAPIPTGEGCYTDTSGMN